MRRSPVLPALAWGLLACPWSAGCEAGGGPHVTVTDSAGLPITLTRDDRRVYARVHPEPVLDLGGAAAPGPTRFDRIAGVHVDPAGRIWVADGGSGEVRIFQADGVHWKTRGGRGQGPGEFRRMRLLGSTRDDTVAVADDAGGRVTFFDPAGEPARTVRLPDVEDVVPLARGIFPDGSLLARVPRILRAAALEPGRILADTVRLVRVAPDGGAARPRLLAPGPLWLWTGRSQVPVPFTTDGSWAVRGDSVHLVSGSAFRVRVYEEGRLVGAYGVVRAPRSVTASHLAAWGAVTEEYVSAAVRPDYRAALDHPSRPELLPAWSEIVAGRDGTIWTRRYDPDPRRGAVWDVFDAGRRWLGRVDTPAGFTLLDVTGGRLVGVWRDRLDVEHLRVYRLSRD